VAENLKSPDDEQSKN